MLLKQFKQVAEIDDMISQIHEELTELYRERSSLMGSTSVEAVNLPQVVKTKRTDWTLDQYDALKSAWAKYDTAIPAYSSLKSRLSKAYKLLQDISTSKPDWRDQLELVLVPPTNKLNFPVQSDLRLKQSFITSPDYVDAMVAKAKTNRSWRLLIVFNGDEAIYAGSVDMMLDKKNSKVSGYDVTALGAREYSAFTLQANSPVDTQTWTVLPKERLSDAQVVCAAYVDGQYRFDIDEVNGIFGDNRFRPAIEVKA